MISIRVLDNDRITARGAGRSNDGVTIDLNSAEKRKIEIDWSGWLGTDTIDEAVIESTGASVTEESNTTTETTMTVQANDAAVVRSRITTTDGAIKELPIYINGGQLYARPRDYC